MMTMNSVPFLPDALMILIVDEGNKSKMMIMVITNTNDVDGSASHVSRFENSQSFSARCTVGDDVGLR